MRRVFRYGVCFLAILVFCGCLIGCDHDGQEPVDPRPEETRISVVENGASVYKIIRSDLKKASDPPVAAAIELARAIREATGCDVPIGTDYYKRGDAEQAAAADAACEILVGETNRSANGLIPTDLSKDEFVILQSGTKILIEAGSPLAWEHAVAYFLSTYLGYDEATGRYAANGLSVPENLSYRGKFDYPPVVYVVGDIRAVVPSTMSDDATWNDLARLIVSYQGLYNRDHDVPLYVNHDSADPFWLEYLSGEGKMYAGCEREDLPSWKDFWAVFGEDITARGIVVWDPAVPATADAAETICGLDGCLPVRFCADKNSLYTFLVTSGVPVAVDLCGKFDGVTVPDCKTPSSGSAKCDVYLWLLEKYGERCRADKLAYVLDGASGVPGNPIHETLPNPSPDQNMIYHLDYYTYLGCFCFDLLPVPDEAPCDDPDQPMGSDYETFCTILDYFRERWGSGINTVLGFPPWAVKYSTHNDHGKLEPTTLEATFSVVLSDHGYAMEADNGRGASNGSVYCRYTSPYESYDWPKEASGLVFDPKVKYVTVYMGDYDNAGWMKSFLPSFLTQRSGETVPLMWGFDPNLYERGSIFFDFFYENRTDDDFAVAGDSGAGYVRPSHLPDLDEWTKYNGEWMARCGFDAVGFILEGSGVELTEEVMASYAATAPAGSFFKADGPKLRVYNDETVFLYLQSGIDLKDPSVAYHYQSQSGSNFFAVRTTATSPDEVIAGMKAYVEYANGRNDGYTYRIVDPYTLLDLVLQSGQGEHYYGD